MHVRLLRVLKCFNSTLQTIITYTPSSSAAWTVCVHMCVVCVHIHQTFNDTDINEEIGLGVESNAFNPSSQEAEAGDVCGLKARLVYRV